MATQDVKKLTASLVGKLIKAYQPQKVILYGSYAYGSPRPDSDLDLLIIKDTPDRLIDRMAAVRRILTDPKREIGLEILVLTPQEIEDGIRGGNQFLTEIIENGIVLYAA